MAKNFVSNKDESVAMFSHPFLNAFTKVHYSVPLIIFVPVVGYFLYRSIFVSHIPVFYLIPLMVFGLAIWTFTEYNMHRFVFHWMPPTKYGPKVNFMFHGVHHDYPRDSMRLVMVPVVSIPLALIFYFGFGLLLGSTYVSPFFVGFVTGYLFYDLSHYALHHANFKSRFWLDLKQHHMTHHYSDPDHGYGVTTKFWDLVYHTTFRKKPGGPVVVEETHNYSPELEGKV